MLCWTPDDAPTKHRLLCASSKKMLREQFPNLKIKEYNVSEVAEVTLQQFREATAGSTKESRHAAMTQIEIDRELAEAQVTREQMAGPMRLAGMGTVAIKIQDSFSAALKTILEEEGKAVLARLVGDKNESLGGEVLEGTALPSQLKGKIPAWEPCYAVLRATPVPAEDGSGDLAKRLLLISWLPPSATVVMKMRCSTFKASIVAAIKDRAGAGVAVLQSEVNGDADLVDELASPAAPVAEEPAHQDALAAPPGGGRKPPPGAVAMPGMVMPIGGLAALKK